MQLTSLLKQADSGRRKLNISVSKGSETLGGSLILIRGRRGEGLKYLLCLFVIFLDSVFAVLWHLSLSSLSVLILVMEKSLLSVEQR